MYSTPLGDFITTWSPLCPQTTQGSYAGDNLFSLLLPSRTKSLTAICLSLAWFLASAYYFAYCFFAASWSLTCCNRTSLWPPASTNSSGLVVNFLLKNSSARLSYLSCDLLTCLSLHFLSASLSMLGYQTFVVNCSCNLQPL